ncbi:hypothetical protein ABTF40_18575, partial [Acinetobacter baumannii]
MAVRAEAARKVGDGHRTVGDGGVASRAGVIKIQIAVVGDSGVAGRTAVVEIQTAVVGDGGVTGRTGVVE